MLRPTRARRSFVGALNESGTTEVSAFVSRRFLRGMKAVCFFEKSLFSRRTGSVALATGKSL